MYIRCRQTSNDESNCTATKGMYKCITVDNIIKCSTVSVRFT